MSRKEKGLLIGILAVLAVVWLITMPGCPVRNLTGIPCPACGMTRAWMLALRLDLAGALRMHPMFWSGPVLLWLFWRDLRILGRKWLGLGVLGLLTGGILICYAFRMYFGLIN